MKNKIICNHKNSCRCLEKAIATAKKTRQDVIIKTRTGSLRVQPKGETT